MPNGVVCLLISNVPYKTKSAIVLWSKTELKIPVFVAELMKNTNENNLILKDCIKPSALYFSISALLLIA